MFILMHVTDPREALLAMYTCVLPGGALACEEPEMSKCYSSKECEAFTKAMEWHLKYAEACTLDFDLGAKLEPLFRELGFSGIEETLTQPIVY